MKKDQNQPAFPNNPETLMIHMGLTKRELIAAMAMQGLCANPKYGDMEYNTIARESVAAADWLLKRLSDNNV